MNLSFQGLEEKTSKSQKPVVSEYASQSVGGLLDESVVGGPVDASSGDDFGPGPSQVDFSFKGPAEKPSGSKKPVIEEYASQIGVGLVDDSSDDDFDFAQPISMTLNKMKSTQKTQKESISQKGYLNLKYTCKYRENLYFKFL